MTDGERIRHLNTASIRIHDALEAAKVALRLSGDRRDQELTMTLMAAKHASRDALAVKL